jgi:hypothetical protein
MNQTYEFPSDPLSQLQLHVARRADELARGGEIPFSLSLHNWFTAESELFGFAGAVDELPSS